MTWLENIALNLIAEALAFAAGVAWVLLFKKIPSIE